MIVAVLFFLCGIIQIMGRPSVGSNNIDNVKFEQIPPWPPSTDTYLLPRKLNVDDTINITVFIKNTPVLNISLITVSSTSNSKRVLCTLMADKNSGNVIFFNEAGEHIIEQNAIENFYHEDDETTFKVTFKRRAHTGSDHKTALQIKSTTFSGILSIPDEDDLRLLKFSGKHVKVSEMDFKFA